MVRILVADKLADAGLKVLEDADDVEFDVKTGLKPDELKKTIGDYDGVIVRSATKLTADVLAAASRLQAVARAGVGVDNVDCEAATAAGILVMNTPDANTISTAEHTVMLMMALSRDVVSACESLKSGKWDRKAFVGAQLAGKTLGVIGLGRIGAAVARRGLGLEMRVIGYDPFFTEKTAVDGRVPMFTDLDAMVAECDFLTVHTPKTEKTAGMIGEKQLGKAKPSLRIINCARGGIIDEAALAKALADGKIAGAGLDVFSAEPPEDRTLLDLPNVVCTPHLGAQTAEAQRAVAEDAARCMVAYLCEGRVIANAVNAPRSLAVDEATRPFLELISRMGKLLAPLAEQGLKKLTVTYRGPVGKRDTGVLTRTAAVTVMQPSFDARLNVINVGKVADDRGIEIAESRTEKAPVFANQITIEVVGPESTHSIEGAVFGDGLPRILAIDGYRMEMKPAGEMIILFNDDRPGVIGLVGMTFGAHDINIADMTISRQGDRACMLLSTDTPPNPEGLAAMAAQGPIRLVKHVSLPEL